MLAVFLAFLFGAFVGFTPCVYPVLPITVSYIGSISKKRRIDGFLHSLVYVLGMALVYCAVGLIFMFSGRTLGSLWSQGWVLFGMANVFLLLGLWQLGVIRIPIPQLISGSGGRRGGYIGAFGVGAVCGLVVGPCTLPGLAVIITYITSNAAQGGGLGRIVYGVIVLFAYSLGMGSLVLLCGTFSGLLASLPKSGRWLSVVEKVFAGALILMAEFFLIYLGQRAINFPDLAVWLGKLSVF